MGAKARTGALVLLASLLGSSAAFAAEGGEGEAKARQLFREGVALQDKGDLAGARESYEAAYALWKNPKIQANLGAVYEGLGRPLDAARAYDRFLDETPKGEAGRRETETA